MPEKEKKIEQLSPGLTYEELDAHFHKYVFTDVTRQTVDAYFAKASENDRLADEAQKHLRELYVLPNGALFSPYLVNRAMELSRAVPDDLRVSMAVIADGIALTIVRTIIFARLTNKSVQATRFFKTEEEALAWMEERVNQLGV